MTPMRLFVCFALFAGLAAAQVDQGRLTGTVSDASGGVLPNVTVKITNQKTGAAREAVTNASGIYFAPGLSASNYTITATTAGMEPAEYKDVNLAVGQERTLNITLQAAGVATSVTVSGGELAVVETSSA